MTIFWKYRNLIVSAITLIALASLYLSWHSRGQVIDVLRAEAKVSQAQAEAFQKAGDKLAEQLRQQNAAVRRLHDEAEARADLLQAELNHARTDADRVWKRLKKAESTAHDTILHEDGDCDAQVAALIEGMR